MNETDLRQERVSAIIIERVKRIRGIYSYWLQFPTKTGGEVAAHDMRLNGVGRAQAYDDVHLMQLLLGNLQQGTKEFYRWKINQDLEHDLTIARNKGDMRAVAALEAARIKNNRTDKDDEPELEFDKIVPQQFVPTDDPSVIGIKKVPGLRERIRQLERKYSTSTIEDAEFEEINE